MAETKVGSEFTGAVLQDAQQFVTTDPAESMTIGTNDTAADVHIDRVPVDEVVHDFLPGILVGLAKVLERLVREHDTPTVSVSASIALEYGDLVLRVVFLEKDCQIQTGRTPAYNRHLHLPPPPRRCP